MSAWIPASERLPEKETPVIAVFRGEPRILERRTETPTWEDTFEAFDYWDDPTDDRQEIDDSDVSHWMPVPALPTEITQEPV